MKIWLLELNQTITRYNFDFEDKFIISYFFAAIWYVLDIYKAVDNKRDKKILDNLVTKVMELDQLMEEGYRGAYANIRPLQ